MGTIRLNLEIRPGIKINVVAKSPVIGTYEIFVSPTVAKVVSVNPDAIAEETEKLTLAAQTISNAMGYSIPTGALSRAKTAILGNALRVAFWGDSITEGFDYGDISSIYASRLTTLLKKIFPNVAITAQNFGLGSRTASYAALSTYCGISSDPSNINDGFWRYWSVIGKSWRDHVKEFEPDLLFIAFGMNDTPDGYVNEVNHITNIINFVNTWDVVPSIVLVTTQLPTVFSYRSSQNQSLTNDMARAFRDTAEASSLACADASRIFQAIRDGHDPVTQANFQKIFYEDTLLGSYPPDARHGNGINHPTDIGHGLHYLASFSNVINSLLG